MKRNHRNILRTILALALVALGAWLVAWQIQHDTGPRLLVSIVNRLPESEQLKPIPCSRAPLANPADKVALQQVLPLLVQPAQRATAYCLLGNYPSALAAYEQSASGGDDGAVLQVYFLQSRQGNMPAAGQALSSVHLSAEELQSFYSSVVDLKLNIDLLPVVQRMVERNPNNPDNWRLWLGAAQAYEHGSNWQSALAAYLEAILVQEKLGVSIGRSSFELGAGRIYQTRLMPHDLNSALSYYNDAIAAMDFLNATDSTSAYLYRGEVYQGMSPVYTPTQALGEFLHALALDPKNYRALRDIAGIYLYNLKDYPSAQHYNDLVIGLNPDLPAPYITRGDIYRAQGDLKAAASAYQDALAHQPGNQVALNRLAAVQAKLQ